MTKKRRKKIQADYTLLCEQLRGLAEISSDWLPVLSNASALLFETLPDINWAGFYLVRGDSLLLGPFQGKTACVRIAKGRGVCGTAWKRDCVLVIPDVHEFQEHIACDSASRSEIVIPMHLPSDRFASGPAGSVPDPASLASGPAGFIPVSDGAAEGTVCGVLDIDSPLPGRFTQDDRDGPEYFAEGAGRYHSVVNLIVARQD